MTIDKSKPLTTGTRHSIVCMIRAVGGCKKRRGQDVWDTVDGDVLEIRAHGDTLALFAR